MERIETQRKQIKDWLLKGKTITAIEALNMFGAFRLSAHIFVLKNDHGLPIETEIVYEEGGKRYAKYYIKKDNWPCAR